MPKKNTLAIVRAYQYIVIPIVVVLIIILTTIFYIVPTLGQVNANKKLITQEKEQLQKLQAKVTTLSAADEASLDRQLAETRAALPELKNVPGLIAGLSRLATETNVTIDALQLKPGKIATESAAQDVAVKLSIQGDLKNMNAFLNKMGQIRRLFVVQKLNGAGGVVGGQFVTAMDVVFYTLPLPVSLGENYADPLPELTSAKQKVISQIAQYPIYTEGQGAVSIALPASSSATPVVAPTATASARPVAPTPRTASPSASR